MNVMLLQKRLFSRRITQNLGQILINKEFQEISRDNLSETLNLLRFRKINIRENEK